MRRCRDAICDPTTDITVCDRLGVLHCRTRLEAGIECQRVDRGQSHTASHLRTAGMPTRASGRRSMPSNTAMLGMPLCLPVGIAQVAIAVGSFRRRGRHKACTKCTCVDLRERHRVRARHDEDHGRGGQHAGDAGTTASRHRAATVRSGILIPVRAVRIRWADSAISRWTAGDRCALGPFAAQLRLDVRVGTAQAGCRARRWIRKKDPKIAVCVVATWAGSPDFRRRCQNHDLAHPFSEALTLAKPAQNGIRKRAPCLVLPRTSSAPLLGICVLGIHSGRYTTPMALVPRVRASRTFSEKTRKSEIQYDRDFKSKLYISP